MDIFNSVVCGKTFSEQEGNNGVHVKPTFLQLASRGDQRVARIAMGDAVTPSQPVPQASTSKQSLSLEIDILHLGDENDISGISNDHERGASSLSLDMACETLQKLLHQIEYNDSPPSNEEQIIASTSDHKAPSSPSSFSRQVHVQPFTSGDTPTGRHSYQFVSKDAQRKLGNAALAALCTRTLETIGKPPTSSLLPVPAASPREKSPKLSPWRHPSPKNWLRRRNKLGVPLDSEVGEASSASPKIDSSPLPLQSDRCDPETREPLDGQARETHVSSVAAGQMEPNRLQMFGSEYARYLSTTALAPRESVNRGTSNYHAKSLSYKRRRGATVNNLEDSNVSVLTGAITDVVVTYGEDPLPKGYYRISQGCSGQDYAIRESKTTAYICVKKESNWDRAAQRPCVTALAVIFPERMEFVPPSFCLVRQYKATTATNGESIPANLNLGGEPVFLCFRRSREGNPLTGLIPLQPSEREPIPEGYTVMERTPRNFVANIHTAGAPVFLAYRQRLANLETLRPLPLVISLQRSTSSHPRLQAYYCTGGTIVQSKVGRFHIMDRSTHRLLSPNSFSNRLSLIEISRRKALNTISDNPSGVFNTYTSSAHQTRPPRSANELLTSSLLLEHGLSTPSNKSVASDMERLSTLWDYESVASSYDHQLSVTNTSQSSVSITSDEASSIQTPVIQSGLPIHAAADTPLHRCLEALSFIPVVSSAIDVNDPKELSEFQSRVAVLTPILTACYTRHGGSALIAVEGLSSLLQNDFFTSDVVVGRESFSRLTLLDISIQVVCDVATTGTQETQLQACIEFVQAAVRYGCGHLNARSVGFVFRFYMFVFHWGASMRTGYPNIKRGSMDVFMLEDPRSLVSSYLAGGAPQSAALSLKDLIYFSILRLRTQPKPDQVPIQPTAAPADERDPPEIFNDFLGGLIDEIVDESVNRVDMANYTQLALHQIHRSGGSELFWYDMMNSCGMGLFGNDAGLSEETRNMFILCFAILASLVKVASSKIRRTKANEVVPQCFMSKLLSLELLQVFLETWRDEQTSLNAGSRSVSAFALCVRRLVVPCLLFNTKESLSEPRVFRRLIRIVGVLWCSSFYRRHMKLELGILLDHFVIRLLELGPQLPSKSKDSFPLLLEQQVELIQELRIWFSLGSRDLLELYLNFDAEASSQMSGPIKLLSGNQWKIWQRLSASLCSIAELCGEFIGDHIRQSRAVTSPKVETNEPINVDDKGARDRVAAQRLRKAALEAIAQMVKCMAESAARYEVQGCENRSKSTTARKPSKTVKSNDGIRFERKTETTENSASIVNYWQRAISSTEQSIWPGKSVYSPKCKGSKSDWESSPVYSGIGRLQKGEEAAGKVDHLGIALDITKRKSLNKAIDYMIACNVLTTSPRDIASFLRIHKEDLKPKAVGKFLGEGGVDGSETEYWNLIRFNYIRANSFVGMNVEHG